MEKTKTGYKQTEVGIVPEDWEIGKIDFLCDKALQKSPKDCSDNVFQYYDIQSVDGELGVVKDLKLIGTSDAPSRARKIIKSDDVIVSTVRPNLKGTCIVQESKYLKIASTGFCVLRAVNIPFKYLYSVARSDKFVKYLIKNNVGTSYPAVNDFIVRDFLFAFPKEKSEQKAIAKALSDVDNLIDGLEKLIAKKKDIKTATMQKLFPKAGQINPDIRLKDKNGVAFTGDWEEMTLSCLGKISSAGVDKKIVSNENPVRLLNFMDVVKYNKITNKHVKHIVTAPKPKISKCNLIKGDMVLTPSSETREDLGFSSVIYEDLKNTVYSYHVVRLRFKIDIDLDFKKYMLSTEFFRQQSQKLGDGSGQRYVLSIGSFNKLKCFIPKSKSEQVAIGKIISDMDAEIEILEQKLQKTKQIKIGMMQELLTGQTRLV